MEEKRARPRVDFRSVIEILTANGKELFEELRNISMAGFFIKTDHSFDKDKEYKFELMLTCGERKLTIVGKCIPQRLDVSLDKGEGSEKGTGFKITYLEPDSSEELYNVVMYNAAD